jgi:type VI secretion system secreted protein Hcp
MAVVDYFLKIDGIEGEAQDKTHKNEIQLESWSFGETNAGTAGQGLGMGAGPKLFLACADGEHIKKAILTCRKAGKDQQEYLKWSFSDLLVSSYQTGGSASSDVVPLDQISINFTEAQIDYKEQKADGTLGGAVTTKYNVKTQSAA